MTTGQTAATSTDLAEAFVDRTKQGAARDAVLDLHGERQAVLFATDCAATALPAYALLYPKSGCLRAVVEAVYAGGAAASGTAFSALRAAVLRAHAKVLDVVEAAVAEAAVAEPGGEGGAIADADTARAALSAVSAVSCLCKAVVGVRSPPFTHVYRSRVVADAAAWGAFHAALVTGWPAVRALWLAAFNNGAAFDPAWRTPLARELAADEGAYQVLLDHLDDLGADVDDLRGASWARSNWAVYHLTEGS